MQYILWLCDVPYWNSQFLSYMSKIWTCNWCTYRNAWHVFGHVCFTCFYVFFCFFLNNKCLCIYICFNPCIHKKRYILLSNMLIFFILSRGGKTIINPLFWYTLFWLLVVNLGLELKSSIHKCYIISLKNDLIIVIY